jgi:NitT/TauT family transport system permease protein
MESEPFVTSREPESISPSSARTQPRTIFKDIGKWIIGPGLAWTILAVSVVIWEFLIWFFKVPSFILPSPSAILELTIKERGLVWMHLRTTLWEIGIGYGVSAIFGVCVAIVVVQYPLVERIVMPFLVASQTIPKIAVAPLFVIWFGAGVSSKILVIGLITFFPITINTITGFKEVESNYLDVFRSVAASDRDIFLRLRLPYSVPYIFAGLQVATTLSVLGAIVAEWVASSQGIGYLILSGSSNFNTARTFTGILALVIVGMVFFNLVSCAERLFSWRHNGKKAIQTETVF